MLKSRLIHLLFSFSLILIIMGLSGISAFAANETPTPAPTTSQPTLTLDSTYPSISADSGSTFSYDVNIIYTGTDHKLFTMEVTAPQDWTGSITAGSSSAQITSIQIDPGSAGTATETVTLSLTPNPGVLPDPGDYDVTLKVSSGSLTSSITLEARVKAKYALSMNTTSGDLTTQATAGKQNHFSFNIVNSGTAAIDQLNLSSSSPDGWTITFTPTKIDSISAGKTQQIDAFITPSDKTVAGDYMIKLKADNAKNTSNIDVRVTVERSSIWRWLALVIAGVVIIGLLVLFWKKGKR
jgi:uncharacterized membrane protein